MNASCIILERWYIDREDSIGKEDITEDGEDRINRTHY